MPRRRVNAAALSTIVVLATVSGCESVPEPNPHHTSSTPTPTTPPAWHQSALPAPHSPPGHLIVQSVTYCGAKWYLGGAIDTGNDQSYPALWSSPDTRHWHTEPITAHTYYGQRALLTSLGCRNGQLAAIGAKPGGAHGNPRVTSWWQRGDTTLVDVDAPFELFGGPSAVNVGPVHGGPNGWLIAGNRTGGPAVWVATDPRTFTLIDHAPHLADGDGWTGLAQDVTWDGDRWVLVGGGGYRTHLHQQPLAWTSTDGHHWTREPVPGSTEFADLQRVVAQPGGAIAVGLRDNTFGAWRRAPTGWTETGTFGRLAPTGTTSARVLSLTVAGSHLAAAVSDGSTLALWASPDATTWTQLTLPTNATAGGGRSIHVDGSGDTLLLTISDATTSTIWSTQTLP